MKNHKFYDIHFHSMDLSHANITAFINRIISENNDLLNEENIKKFLKENIGFWKKLCLPLAPFSFLARKILESVKVALKEKKILESSNNVRNLLSFMENSILYSFLVVEYFLKNKRKDQDAPVSGNNQFTIDGKVYEKIVLCPLVMDFGYKDIYNDKIFYNIPPQKPVTSQIKDLFEAIRTYYNHDVKIVDRNGRLKFEVSEITPDRGKKLFEILPFMGINTENYSYDEIKGILDKYFVDFSAHDTAAEREQKLMNKMGAFKGDLDDAADCKNIFTGIKLYPPLGFDPWPEGCKGTNNHGENCKCSRAKVKLLYETCVNKRIPVTTHCSNGGFTVAENCKEITNPGGKWKMVLQEYPQLKIDFAHFGSGDIAWQKTIESHIEKYDHIYTDFSCNTKGDAYYEDLAETIRTSAGSNKLEDRILYGSDFMINMLWLESYNEYFTCFMSTNHLTEGVKHKFCNENSRRFLFGI